MKNKIYYVIISLFTIISFFSCGEKDTDYISYDFKLKTNLEYGTACKVDEVLKIGIVIDSIDSNFNGSWNTTIKIDNPTNCDLKYNSKSILSTDELNHNFKEQNTMWLEFSAQERGEYRLTAFVSNGKIEAKKITIDISVSEYIYKITLICDETEGEVLGAGDYAKGKLVKIEAQPKAGYSFKAWYKDGEPAIYTSLYSFEAVSDITYEARFEKSIFKIEASVDGEGTVSGTGDYPKGSSAVLTANPAKYWKFAGWYNENNTLLGTSNTYTISKIEKNMKVTAKFIMNIYISFYLNGTGNLTNTTCSEKRFGTKSVKLTARLTAYRDGYPVNVSMVSEPLAMSFGYHLNNVIWSKSGSKYSFICSGYNDTNPFSESFSIYKTSYWESIERENPRGDYGGWYTLSSLYDLKYSPTQIQQTGNSVIVNSVLTITIGSNVTYYTIPTTKSANDGLASEELEPIPLNKSLPTINI